MPKETYWNVEVWPLDCRVIEERCDQRDLWATKANATEPIEPKGGAQKPLVHYWDHDVAPIDSRSDRICLLMGVLSFLNGRWELRDRTGSVECVAVDRDCQQFCDRCVFATKFTVHRESFTVGDSTHRRVYVGIDEFHAASLPLAKSDVDVEESSSVDGVRFLALSKSMPQMTHLTNTAIRHIFGYLVVASFHGQSPAEDPPTKRSKKEILGQHCGRLQHHHQQQQQHLGDRTEIDEERLANCILFVDHDHPTLSYPALVEGRVYEIRLPRRKLLSNP